MNEDTLFMEILDMVQDLSTEKIEALLPQIETILEKREEELKMGTKSNEHNACPICNHKGLTYTSTEYTDNEILYKTWTCPKCKAQGEEQLKVKFETQLVYNKDNDEYEYVD